MKSYKEGIKLLNKYNTTCLMGEELFYRDQIKNLIISKNKESDIIKIDASQESPSNINSLVQTKDLFSSKKIIIISDFQKIKKYDFLKQPLSNIVILEAKKAYKPIQKIKEVLCIDCSTPKPWLQESDALGKILGFFKSKGYNISKENAIYLYNHIGFKLYKLIHEMNKICLYKEDTDKTITKKDIENVCVLGTNYNVFDIFDKIIARNKKDALDLLERTFKYENSPSILLISLWYNHFENLLFLKDTTKTDKEIMIQTKLPMNVISRKYLPQANKLTSKKIITSMSRLLELDYKIRQGIFNPKYYLEQFILKF